MIQPARSDESGDSTPSPDDDPVLEDLIEDCTDRLQAGEEIDLERLAARHPEHADRLRRLLPSLRMMVEVGRSSMGATLALIPGRDALGPRPAGPFELGDYRVLRIVGRGGMGIVYEATQLSLNRRVALKILPFAAALDPNQLRRFQIEAQAAAHLHHSRNCLADAFRGAGRLSAAITLQAETLRLSENALGPDHPATLQSLGGMASVYEALGRWDEAERLSRVVVTRRRKIADLEHPVLADDLAALGRSLIRQSKWRDAESPLRESLVIYEKAMPDDWRRYLTMSQLGDSLLGQGRFAEAEPLIIQGYEGLEARKVLIPAPARIRHLESADRILRLYKSWGRVDLGAEWKSRLAMPDFSADVFARP